MGTLHEQDRGSVHYFSAALVGNKRTLKARISHKLKKCFAGKQRDIGLSKHLGLGTAYLPPVQDVYDMNEENAVSVDA